MAETNEPAASSGRRLASLDQFRGYTVAGMFLVNFLGNYDVISKYAPVLKHNHNYYSYADTIMPQFFFAVGFAMRLTLGRKLSQPNAGGVRWRFLKRCFALMIISAVLSPMAEFRTWNGLLETGIGKAVFTVLKADLWETLALIGATCIWILPWIEKPAYVRLAFLFACAAAQMALSHWFLFNFDLGLPNRLDELLGTSGRQVFDGGFFGFLTWCIPMLTGTLACDLVTRREGRTPAVSIAMFGAFFMVLGYAMSCVSTFYNPEYNPSTVTKKGSDTKYAESPVIPPKVDINKDNWKNYLAEPPFFPPRVDRPWNSWMMTKRTVSVSIMLFASGFSLAVYSVFAVLADWCGLTLGLFRTLGSNALAAYVIHEIVEHGIRPSIPRDSPWWFVAIGFVVFFAISYGAVRYLERNKIYIRA